MLTALWTAGTVQVVFAGADPSIRPDIVELIDYSRSLGLRIEVQTNAHRVDADFLEALEKVDLVGLSLDGPDAYSHDSFRGKPGNFSRVMDLLRRLNEKDIPVVVRTVVSKRNGSDIPRIASLLGGLSSVVRWSLLEFSPIGDGATNREEHLLSISASSA